MSNKPAPVSLTTAMLTRREYEVNGCVNVWSIERVADLASRLHRLAPQCKRIAIAEAICSDPIPADAHSVYQGEDMSEGFRVTWAHESWIKVFKRNAKAIERLNEALKPLALVAKDGGDPRGPCLYLESTDPKHPLPRNGWAEGWAL